MKMNFLVLFLVARSFILQAGNLTMLPDSIPANAFEVGERLTYDVKYGFVRGGEAACEVGIIPLGYSFAYHFRTIIETTGLVEKLATIRDIYESYVDLNTHLTVKAIRNIKEDTYTSYNEVVFNRKAKKILSANEGDLENVPDNVMDIIGAFYYARNYMFKHETKNAPIEIPIYLDQKIYQLKLHFIKFEKISTAFGIVRTKLFIPIVENESYKLSEEDLKIWISDDNNFIPVKIMAKTKIGKLKLVLKEYTGTKSGLKSTRDAGENENTHETEENEGFFKSIFNILRKKER